MAETDRPFGLRDHEGAWRAQDSAVDPAARLNCGDGARELGAVRMRCGPCVRAWQRTCPGRRLGHRRRVLHPSPSRRISIDAASQVSTITVTLTYNPTVLRVRAVQEGSFMRQGSLEVAFSEQIDAIAGRIDIGLTRIADLTGASGSGLLAAILFDAVSSGGATLTANSAALTAAGTLVPTQSSPLTITVR